MSASAESLDSIECHSNSLLSILDEVFKPNNRGLTPPTSNFSSSKRNSLFNSHSNRSESTNNSSPKGELILNSCNHEANDVIDEHIQDIDVITEENASNSEMITSFYMNPLESSIAVIPTSPIQRKIVKQPLKKCYSFNDIDIRRIITLNKKSESVQTFTSTYATLSVEIISSENSGELTIIEEKASCQSEPPKPVPDQPSVLRSFMTHPVVLSTFVLGGLLLLIPTYQKLSAWVPTLAIASISSTHPIIEPPLPMPQPSTYPIYYIADAPKASTFLNHLRAAYL